MYLSWPHFLLKMVKKKIIIMFLFLNSGCTGSWVWQEDYPKHRTMSFKCPRWNYNEAYDELHHIYATRQHEPIKVNDKKRRN